MTSSLASTAPSSPPTATARRSSPAYHYWGAEALTRLRGMFAFALWDTEERELFCARDPFGIKPLFMATGPGGTAVGSEKKCLLDLAPIAGFDLAIDERAVQHYTVLQYVPEPETLHRGIRRLESGSYARIRPGQAPEVTRYFVPQFRRVAFVAGAEQARYDEITAVLEDSVAKHMRADVTVGAFLSGGIDSTAIAALAMRHNPRLITFTTGFEREGFSEVDVAVASAEAIGARHVTKVVSQAEFVAALPEIVWYLDEPVADPALVPLFFIAREARKHVKVVLSGEGADELFGGYTIYREPLSLQGLRLSAPAGAPIPRQGQQAAARRDAGQEPAAPRVADARGALLRQRAQLLRRAAARDAARVPAGVDPHRRHRAALRVLRRVGSGRAHAAHRPVHLAARRHPGQGRQDDDGELTGTAGAVPGPRGVRGGRASCRSTRRSPGPPPSTRCAGRWSRSCPAHVLNRAKLGFPVPIRHWLRAGELLDWAYATVAASQAGHLVDIAAVRRMLDEHRTGVTDHSRRLWTVLIFMLWHAIFVEHSVTPEISEPDYPVQL